MQRIFVFLASCFFIWGTHLHAQSRTQLMIDSLSTELKKVDEDTQMVKILNRLSYAYPYIDPDAGLRYAKFSLQLAQTLQYPKGIAGAYMSLGANYANKAEYDKALEADYMALKIYENLHDLMGQAKMLRNIAIIYHTSDNQLTALKYDFKALSIFQQLGDKYEQAIVLGNIANVYYSMDEFDKVIEFQTRALKIYEEINDLEGVARMLGNMGNFYAIHGDFNIAMVYYFRAIRLDDSLGNKNGVVRNMGNVGETFLDIARSDPSEIRSDSIIPSGRAANLKKALEYLSYSVNNAKTMKQTEYYLAFGEVLSDAYHLSGKNDLALELYKEYIMVRDSVYDVRKLNEVARRELEYEYGRREDSISFQKQLADLMVVEEKKMRTQEKWFFGISLVVVLIFSGFMFNRWQVTQKQKRIIEKEKKRSEELLLNILPEEVAEELKQKGSADAKHYDEVTVMFTDFKGFTGISELLTPEELVAEIDYCFKAFDEIITRHKIEKIKTIGDAYMAAAGLPVANKSHADDMIYAALEIQRFMLDHYDKRKKEGKPAFEIRIGCHTGPVVAGIVGIKKFAYDIWGDTVNIAARMESSGEAGKVNISETTYELVKDQFICVRRGKIQAKGKGEIEMAFVEGVKNPIP